MKFTVTCFPPDKAEFSNLTTQWKREAYMCFTNASIPDLASLALKLVTIVSFLAFRVWKRFS